MNIYLIRHTNAEPITHLKNDKERELTEEGTKLLQDSVSLWKSFLQRFDYILSSPYKRAVQTASVIAEYFIYENEIIKDNSLAPGSNSNAIVQLAASLNGERIAFIGHQPDIGYQFNSFLSSPAVTFTIFPDPIINISFEGKPQVGNGLLKLFLPPVNLEIG